MRIASFVCVILAVSACGPQQVGVEAGETGSSDELGTSGSDSGATATSGTSTSGSSASSTSASDESTSEGEPMPDACQAEPVLTDYEVLLDDHAFPFDYTIEDEHIIWTHTCTVTSHTGSLASGETIGLACTDENAQAVEHTIELRAVVEGAPLASSVVVGQQVELALWLYVWFGGTLTWTLRDSNDELLLLYFDGPYLPAEAEDFAAPLEFVAPLVAGVNAEVCPWDCREADGGTFVPSGPCCERETALRVDLGAGAVEVQDDSAAAIPGGGHVFVETSWALDLSTCNITDVSGTSYAFTIVR